MAPGTGGRPRRKQQTRLSFDPVDAAPSQSRTMSPANVRYEVPGVNRRSTLRTSKQNPMIEDKLLPSKQDSGTPDKSPKKRKIQKLMSSQTLPQMMSSQTHGLTTKVNGLDLEESDSDIEITSSRSVQKSRSTKKSGGRRKSPSPIDLSLVPAGASSFMPRTSKQAKLAAHTADSDVSSSEGSPPEYNEEDAHQISSEDPLTLNGHGTDLSSLQTPLKATTRNSAIAVPKSSPPVAKTKMLSNSTRSKTPSPTKKTSTKRQTTAISVSDDEEDEDEEVVLPSARKSSRPNNGRSVVKIDEDDSDDVFEHIRSSQRSRKVIADDEDSDEDLPRVPAITPPKSSGRQRLGPASSMKRKRASSSEKSSDESESDIAPSPKKRRQDPQFELDSDEALLDVPAFSKSRGSKGKEKAKDSEDEKETRVTRSRIDKKPKRTAKQKQMELLKRRKAGEKIDAVTDSSSDDEEGGGIYDSNSDNGALSQFDDESEVEGIEAVAKSLRPNNRNDYDDSFVVEDDDEPLGAPGFSVHDIPIEFTHHAHKRLKDHFKDIVEWMVQNEINPGFERNDPIYKLAFRKVDDEARGFANSKFSSSSWRSDFTRALWARPILSEAAITKGDVNEGRKCDACGRSGHPAKFALQFEGNPYDQDTLEDIVNDSDDEDDNSGSDSDEDIKPSRRRQRTVYDREGRKVPPEDTVWYVGRFCKANAESAHALVHWRHSLNSWVVDQLKNEGYMNPDKLAKRAKLSRKKLNKHALKIIDDWDKKREIKSLYESFKATLNTARETTQNRWSTR